MEHITLDRAPIIKQAVCTREGDMSDGDIFCHFGSIYKYYFENDLYRVQDQLDVDREEGFNHTMTPSFFHEYFVIGVLPV